MMGNCIPMAREVGSMGSNGTCRSFSACACSRFSIRAALSRTAVTARTSAEKKYATARPESNKNKSKKKSKNKKNKENKNKNN